MNSELTLVPKQKSPNGQPRCEPVVYPDVERAEAERIAGIVDSARQELWAYYYVNPEELEELSGWLISN